MCKIRSDCEPRGQVFVQGAERRFREVGLSGSRSRQTRRLPYVYPASQATSGELTEDEQPTVAANPTTTHTQQPLTAHSPELRKRWESSTSSLRPSPHFILFLPLSITFLVAVSSSCPSYPSIPLILCITVTRSPWPLHLPSAHAGHQHQLQ